MKSAKIIEINQPLQIQENKTPKPKGSQVLVKVQSFGVYQRYSLMGGCL